MKVNKLERVTQVFVPGSDAVKCKQSNNLSKEFADDCNDILPLHFIANSPIIGQLHEPLPAQGDWRGSCIYISGK